MNTKSQRPKERDNVLSTLDIAIEALNLAKEVAAITAAKAVFGSVSALLTMIRVYSLLCDDKPWVYTCPGLHGQQNRLHRTRAILRQCLQSPRPGNEREETG